MSLEEAVAIFSKWKDDSAQILAVSESPFQQSRRGILDKNIDWVMGLQGKVAKVSVDRNMSGKKKEGAAVLEAPGGTLSLSIGHCSFVYEEPKEAKPVVREESESTTVSALSVFL